MRKRRKKVGRQDAPYRGEAQAFASESTLSNESGPYTL